MNARQLKLLDILNANNLSIKFTMYSNTNLVNFHLFQLREYNDNTIIVIDKVTIYEASMKFRLILSLL